jgi:hypothetical protein
VSSFDGSPDKAHALVILEVGLGLQLTLYMQQFICFLTFFVNNTSLVLTILLPLLVFLEIQKL